MKTTMTCMVIGAGSGGVRAARVAAGFGAKVAIAEKHRIGGTCVIRGCVPKKLLVYGAHFAEDLDDARRFGWQIEGAAFDWPTLRDNVLAEVARISGLYRETLENHDVDIYEGHAAVTGANSVRIDGRTFGAKFILIATGARPQLLQVPGIEHVITSNEAFHLEHLPARILIAGGGYIANEFAGIFNELGSKVTLVNRSDQILRSYDAQIRDRLMQISMAKGIQFLFNAPLHRIERRADGVLDVHLGDTRVECEAMMCAVGRVPNTEQLGLDSAGVELDANGAVRVDDYSRSTCPSIYAVGDVTNRVQLTPGRNPRRPGVRGNGVRQQADQGRLQLHSLGGIQPSAASRRRSHGGTGAFAARPGADPHLGLPPDEERARESQRALAVQAGRRRHRRPHRRRAHDRPRCTGDPAGAGSRGESALEEIAAGRSRGDPSHDGGRTGAAEVDVFRQD